MLLGSVLKSKLFLRIVGILFFWDLLRNFEEYILELEGLEWLGYLFTDFRFLLVDSCF